MIQTAEGKNTYNLDVDRIYLHGFSNGAHGAWHFGLSRHDLFAALSIDSGLPVSEKGDKISFDSLVNARNLPVFIVNGKDDPIAPAKRISSIMEKLKEAKCPDIIHKEYPGAHKVHAVESWNEIYKWFQKHKRNAFPRSVSLYCNGTGSAHSYWLELVGAKQGAKASAQVKDGYLEIYATNAEKVVVYLSDKLLNLDKKVTIRLNNARIFQGEVKRSPATALSSCLNRNDREMVYAARLAFDLRKSKSGSTDK